MHIVVPIKQEPKSEELRYDPATRTLVREGVATVINPYDKRALTEAVRLREIGGGSITAVTMGPPQARDALVECLGRGVDRAIHISDPALAGSDTLATARALAAALAKIPFDLVLAGKSTTDSETGQVGPQLAEMLGLAQVTGATAIEPQADGTLLVTRETDWGFERVICPLPALLTAAERLNKPPKTKPPVIEEGLSRLSHDPGLIVNETAAGLGLTSRQVGLSGSPTWVHELRPIEIKRERLVLGDGAGPAVEKMLEVLRGLPAKNNSSTTASRGDLPPLPPPAGPAGPTGPGADHTRKIWAVAEWLPGSEESGDAPRLREVSFELAGEAARLASQVGGEAAAVLMGRGVEGLAIALAHEGADTVLLADSPLLAPYSTEPYTALLAGAIRKYKPWAVLFPATHFGRDLAPRVAARLGLGLTGDSTALECGPDDIGLLSLKPAFGGQIVAAIGTRTLPALTTLRPGALPRYRPDPNREPRIIRLDTEGLPPSRVQVVEETYEGEAGLALDDARLVVCVGVGIGGPESLPEIRQMAGTLGAWLGLRLDEVGVGGTRKVVDKGWLPRHQQIGITGRIVAPDVYLDLGVQGNFNHTAGMMRSGTVISVNNDPNAEIFEWSDLCIVAEWHDFARELVRRIGD